MGRSGYVDEWDGDTPNASELWRANVDRMLKGAKGQKFLRELLAALDALPVKRLIAEDLERDGEVCTIGAVGKYRRIDMSKLDPEEPEQIADAFGIKPMLVQEIEYINDDDFGLGDRTPEQRFERVRKWVVEQ